MNSILFCWPLRMFASNSWVDRIVLCFQTSIMRVFHICVFHIWHTEVHVWVMWRYSIHSIQQTFDVTKQLGKWTQRFSVVCLSPPGLPCQEMTSPYSFSLNCCCVSSKTSFSCVIITVSIQQNGDFVGLVYQMSLKPLLPIFQKSRLLMSTLPKQQHWIIVGNWVIERVFQLNS